MEEKIMLRILILIVINFITEASYATDKDNKAWLEDIAGNTAIDSDTRQWAESIANRDQQMAINNFKEMMQIKGFDSDLQESVLKPRPVLQIFVSISMPKSLLKTYAREASRYGGVLVFRGLPAGSFLKLTDLVMDITDEKHPCAMQIDDEAFKGFNIQLVPAIVLSKAVGMFDEQTRTDKFDKVQGSITIKAALELFRSKGDLANNAREMLK